MDNQNKLYGRIEFKGLLILSDIVSGYVPLTPKTHYLTGETELSIMKPDAILINVSREGIIDDSVLAEAFKQIIRGGNANTM